MTSETSPVARMLANYRPVMDRFLSGEIGAENFSEAYMEIFKNDANQVTGPEFDVLDSIFVAIDDYVEAPELRDPDEGDIDEVELRARVEEGYRRLFG